MLTFVTLRSDYPELRMWGASAGKVTFVITKDEEEFEFNVSVRTVGVPGGGRDLGACETFDGAKIACQNYLASNPVVGEDQNHRKAD